MQLDDARTHDTRRDDKIFVHLPAGIPVLTPHASRILLDILIELTTIEAPGGPEDAPDD